MSISDSASAHDDDNRSVSKSPERRTSLLVRNLDERQRVEDLRKFFEDFGEIRDIYIPRDYYTRKPRGFGFVEFKHYSDAKKALE
mmetsp:Transcript_23633/g.3925  ORF Transcript_23633/g.3925 Transcript_23633/m.3925 type:complete len:85 (+) Transcript_23633:134-388(+)|eukprot:CAMPEP_0168316354 /NCGR_PEP_ID=MMETSP0210-20121227/15259_1 /TAXON_ID=40633 /ORGANISM="Condylostoma magnum, Strain COL2" /LENGTH=84 /DNA_ID=CAMNT_0008296631 /DNA_START=31 /DNA_END=285 /DNA_ORIENTATION=-